MPGIAVVQTGQTGERGIVQQFELIFQGQESIVRTSPAPQMGQRSRRIMAHGETLVRGLKQTV